MIVHEVFIYKNTCYCQVNKKIQSNLSTVATLRTDESGCYREVAIMGRYNIFVFKKSLKLQKPNRNRDQGRAVRINFHELLQCNMGFGRHYSSAVD